jgi:hypothetical protein
MAATASAVNAVRMEDADREPVTAVLASNGELLAMADDRQVWFTPAIDVLETDHPRWRFSAMLSLVARLMQEGDDAERYDPELAAYYARYILIPGAAFAYYMDVECDARLAERFNVPLDQILAKRRDLALAGDR